MADYKRMYLTLMDAVEKATEILIAAQQKCEDIYVSQLMVFPGVENKIDEQSDKEELLR